MIRVKRVEANTLGDVSKKLLSLFEDLRLELVKVLGSENLSFLPLVKEKDGEIMFFSAGYPAPEILVNGNDIHYRRLKLIGAFEAYIENFYLAAQLLEYHLINTEALVETTFPLSKIDEAFAYASEPGRYRVSVLLEEE